MVQITSAVAREQGVDPERFTPGPRVLVHLAAHFWGRTTAATRLVALGLVLGGVARMSGLG